MVSSETIIHKVFSSYILWSMLMILLESCGYLFLTKKVEAFEKFKIFKNIVENESGVKIKSLRSDRGGEFTSREFNIYCEEHGIKR